MQTDYTDMKPAVEGGLGTSEFCDVVSRTADGDIPFGRGLLINSDGLVEIPREAPASGTALFAGVSVQKQMALPNATGVAQYEDGEEVRVLRRGTIWVYAEEAVNPTDEVWMRCGDDDTEEGHYGGGFRTDDDGESDPEAVQITNARWVSTTTAAGLALLEINMP